MNELATLIAFIIVLDVFVWAVPKEDVPEARLVRRG